MLERITYFKKFEFKTAVISHHKHAFLLRPHFRRHIKALILCSLLLIVCCMLLSYINSVYVLLSYYLI